MELRETQTNDMNSSPFLKPTTEIVHNISRNELKIMELKEHCKASEYNLNELDEKIKVLIFDNLKNEKLLIEYVGRNKTNLYNSECLRQVKSQLFKYKCELKFEYIAIQKMLQAKKSKYRKIISSYFSQWQANLEKYHSNLTVKELLNVEKENTNYENELKRLKNLFSITKSQFLELESHFKEETTKKIVEFSKEMIHYKKFLEIEGRKREVRIRKQQIEKIEFFKKKILKFGFQRNTRNEETPISPVNIVEFDELTIPEENLEIQDVDEISIFENSAHKPDAETVEGRRPTEITKTDKTSPEKLLEKDSFENTEKNSQKIFESLGSESQYFIQPQNAQDSEIQNNWNCIFENSEKIVNTEIDFGKDSQIKSGRNFKPNLKIKSKSKASDALSKGVDSLKAEKRSVGNLQVGCEENHVYGQAQSSSVPSEESVSVNAEFHNESLSSPVRTTTDENPKGNNGKDVFKSFQGFFTMGKEQESPTPSIFKLF